MYHDPTVYNVQIGRDVVSINRYLKREIGRFVLIA